MEDRKVDNMEEREKKYYDPLLKILEFENNSKTMYKNIDDDEKKSDEEKKLLKEKLKSEQQEIDKMRELFLKGIKGCGIDELTLIINVLQKIYVEKKDLKPAVKKMLTSQPIRNEIMWLRKQDFEATYDMVRFISKKFPVDDYPMYTLKPQSVLYGAEVDKTAKGSTFLSPLGNDEIMKCLDVFVEKNQWILYNWVMAIFAYDSDNFVNAYKDKFDSERQMLLLNVIELTKKNKKYQSALVDKLFENGDLARLVNLQLKSSKGEEKVKQLETEIETMKKEAEEKEASYWERAERQKAVIDGKQQTIDSLQEKSKNYEMMREKLTACMRKYEAQVSMNERITIENDIRVHDVESMNKEVQEENLQLKSELSEVKGLYEGVKSDLSLKIAEIRKISDDSGRIEEKVKEDILQELLRGIKEQLYYISLYHLELKENGKLEPDSIDMFGDTINNIDSALKTIGIEKYGELDEKVVYDSSVHESMSEKLGNGDAAIIQVPGWRINGEVYVKAQVEKEN